jgi:hypothetical protein
LQSTLNLYIDMSNLPQNIKTWVDGFNVSSHTLNISIILFLGYKKVFNHFIIMQVYNISPKCINLS